ncbi:site-specific integrase [Acinetobacter sp. 5862]|uniref:tyrosine-type recombinase/integrase n=1 Tax=Acinetobacter sp. 5862 TaxID=2967169 RepID=UPI002111B4E0|nr:site-specific integrase [Acinetobacter sp. 5862]
MTILPTSLKETAITHSIRSFECGKEFDLRKLIPDCPVSGIRFVPTEDKVRALARLTFESKKISKSLGTYSHLEFDREIPNLIERVQLYQQRIAKGEHPFDDQETLSKEITFGDFVLSTYLPTAKTRKKSYKDDESRLRNYLMPALAKLTFSEINAGILNQLFTEISLKKLSHATLNRIRALLSAVYKMAIDYELIDTNLVSRVKKYKENNQKERYFNDEELKALVTVLHAPHQFGIDNLVIVSIVRFLLLTGVRKREAMDLQWSHIDLNTGVWLLGENKSGKARRINLNNDALMIIQKLPKQFDYIFANPETGKPYNDIRKTFEKIMRSANIGNVRIHDLRHNFASLAVNSGQSLYVVQHLLGHASPQTTQRYAHLQASTLKQASEDVAAVIRHHTDAA